MRQKIKRILSSALAAVTVINTFVSTLPQAAALGGGDSVTLVFDSDKQNYLREQKNGSWVNLPIHESYATENGEKLLAFCMDHGKHGIHEVAPSTNQHTYILDSGSGYTQNPKAVGVIMRGSGRLSLQSFLNQFPSVPRDLTEDEYRYATQTAIWSALGQLSVSGTAFTSGNAVQVSSSHSTEGARVMAAIKALLEYASHIDHNYYVGSYLRHGDDYTESGEIDWSPTGSSDSLNADVEELDGKEYYTKEIKAASASFCQNNALNVSLYESLPGTLLQIVKDGDHASAAAPSADTSVTLKPISQTTDANENGSEYYGVVKVWVPREEADQHTDYAFNVQISATVESFDIFVGRASGYESSTEYQKYLISGPQWQEIGNKVPIKWGNATIPDDPDLPDDPDDPPEEEKKTGELVIQKVDADTGETLADCTFELEHIESGFKTTVTTLGDGLATFELPAEKTGGWKATEMVAPPGYEKDPNPIQTFHWDGETTPVNFTFQNHQKPSILFVKRDALTGETLKGAVIEVSRNGQKIGDYETKEDGTFTLTELVEGTYTFREKTPPAGYLKTDEVVTQYVNPNEMATGERVIPVEMKDYAELKLKIIKYDQQSNKTLAGVTFEIYCNTELIGRKQTDSSGEINLSGLKPGTYLVKEVATDAEHVVNSTPQQIELKVGQTEPAELVFMNQLKPGMFLEKVDSESLKPIPNVKFKISQVGGTFSKEYTTDINGEIDLSKLEPGAYEVQELLTIDGYLMDNAVRVIQLNPDEKARFVFTNTKKPGLEVLKYDPDNDVYIPGATFRIAKIKDGTHYLDRVTDQNGRIFIDNLEPGVYSVIEQAEPAHYVKNELEYHVELFPGKTSTLVVNNYRKPNLQIVKTDAVTGKKLPGTTFTVNKVDSSTLTTVITGADGSATISDLEPGVYQVSEKNVPDGYLLDKRPQLVTLVPNQTGIVRFYNYPKPSLTVLKLDSVTGDPLKGAKFHITYASNKTFTGEINDLGDYFTDENGKIELDKLQDGWYKVTEVEAPAGYSIKQPATQDAFIKAGTSKTFTFEDVPLSAIVIKKVDADSGKVLEGAWFRIRYLGGTSGTTIGEYMTSSNGTIVKTGLKAGTYIVEEISAPEGYVINDSAQTVYLSGKDQDIVTLTFGNDKKGSLLIIKKDAVTGEPLSDVEFLLTNSDGSVIGNSNGKYVTDSAGTIRVDGLEPGMTVIARETRTRSGYVLDNTPQTIKIKANETMSLEFRNKPKGSLIVLKKDSQTGEPIPNVEFKVTTSSGELVPDHEGQTSTNGIYKTDRNGQIALTKLTPGTYVITEVKVPDEYVLDAPPQTVRVNENDAQTLTFLNTKKGGLVIKKIDSITRDPIPGVTFEIKGDGYPTTSHTTNSSGQIKLDFLPNGSYSVTETRAKDGYKLDTSTRTVTVEAGKTKEITVENEPLGGLLIKKMSSTTKEPLSDVIFKVTRADGSAVGTSGGEFRTNERGFIMIPDLEPAGYIIQEVKAKPGFLLDDTPKHIEIKDHRTYTVEFFNQPKGGLVVVKKDSITGEPLKGVEFKITTSNGELVAGNEGQTSTNGIYVTDENGVIEITRLKPGTYTVVETKTLPDYVLDTQPKTVVVEANDTQTLVFTNTPKGCLVVKKIDSVTHEPLSGVKFEVKGCDGCDYPAGTYTTDSNGMFRLSHIPSGCYAVVETQAKDGYRLDDTVHTVKVEAGACKEVTFENAPLGGLLIKKMAAGTKEPLSDVTFTILTAEGTPVGTSNGKFRTNEDGYISIPDLAPGTYMVKETQAKPGYLLDDTPQTITVKDHQTYTLELFNKPKGNLVVVKTDSQTGEPLSGVEFKITTANGELVPDDEGLTSTNGIYKTDKNGEIVLSKLKPGTYVISESKTLNDYILDAPPQTVVIEANDTQVLNFTNTKKGCLVVTKVDSVTHEPLSGVKFEIKGCNGNAYPADTYTTNSSGVIQLDHIPSGDYSITETQAKEGYRLSDAAQVVNVEAGKTRKITVENEPLGGLLLKKMDAATKEPLSEVVFKITRTDGSVVGESNGEYRTDEHGYISIPDLAPGGYVVTEVQAKPGYLLDNTPKNIDIKDHQTYVLEFFNKQKGGILIVKKDSQTGEPLAGVEFKVTTANGEFVPNNEGLTSTNGVYTTNKDGQIEITQLKPGVYTITETKTLADYVLDVAPQTVVVEANDQQTLTFTNTKKGCLVVTKVDSVTHEPLSGVKFEIKGCNGNSYPADTYVTNSSGVIQLDHIPSGDYTVSEVQAKDGYRLNAEAQVVSVEAGKTRKITFENEPLGGLLIKKMAAGTKEPLPDVIFTVLTADGTPVGTSNGQFRTNEDGYISIPDLVPGTYVVKEVQAKPGYLLDDTPQTITIKDHQTYTLELFNKPKGNLVVVKTDSQTGEPLSGVEFKITTANGELIPNDEGLTSSNGIYKTDKNGEIVLSKLKPGTYVISETKTLDDYILDAPPQTVVIEANDTQVLNFTNTKKGCLVVAKVDSVTHEPLSGVKFEIKGCNGNAYPADTYITNDSGVIQLDHIPSGDYTVAEVQAKDGYRLNAEAQVVSVEAGKTRKITFENEPLGGLLIKKMAAGTKEPLSDVIFTVLTADGTPVGTSNGQFRTNEDGYISIPDLAPGTYVVKEVQAKPGYLLDDTPQTVTVKDHQTYTLELFNKPKGNLVVIKTDSQTGEPLPGVEFKITTANCELVPDDEGLTSSNGVYKTNENGEIVLSKLKPGTYLVSESKTLDDYILDAPPQTVVIESNDTQVLNFTNTKKGCLVVTKVDSVTHEPLSGVKFEIKGCNGNVYPAETYITNDSGVIQLDHIPSGDYTITEMQAKEGYRLTDDAQVVSVEAGKTRKITIENEPLGGLLLKKMDAATKEPLSEVVFKITRTDGSVVGESNGEYRTDERGYISIPDLAPGGYVVEEVQAKPGYLLDNTPKNIDIKDHQTYILEFFNKPKGGILIVKKDSQTGEPLAGVEFKVTTANGEFVSNDGGLTSTNGVYTTNEDGQIEITNVKPGTYTIVETKTLDDYVLDAAPQTVVVEANDQQTLTFTNTKKGCLVVTKVDSVTHEPLSGVKFEIKGCNGNAYPADSYITNSSGVIQLDHIPSGDYTISEVQAKDGYRLNAEAQVVSVEAGKTRKVTFENEPLGGLLIKKMAAGTKEPLSDVIFTVLTADGTPVGTSNGQFRTNEDGYISIPDLAPGTYVVKEVQAKPGYLLDDTPQTVTVKDHQTYTLELFNQPKGNLVVIKTDSQTGEPLPGVEFKITTANGELVPDDEGLTSSNGVYKTNENGEIVLSKLKPSTYLVIETKTLDDYILDAPPQTVVIESNDTQVLNFTNTKKGCLVVTKVDSVTHEPLSGVKFEIKGCNGNAYPADTYITDDSGVIQLDHIPSGDYTIMETQAKEGYRLTEAAQVVNVEAGKTRKITVENEPLGGLLLKKMDAATKEPLSEVVFKITRTDGSVVGESNGEYRTDERGYTSIPDLAPGGYVVEEVQAKPGHLLDNTPKNIDIKDHQTYVLEFFNKQKGGILIVKKDSQTGEPLAGVEFKVTTANGEFVPNSEGLTSTNGIYTTNEDGQIEIVNLKPGTYVVSEVRFVP